MEGDRQTPPLSLLVRLCCLYALHIFPFSIRPDPTSDPIFFCCFPYHHYYRLKLKLDSEIIIKLNEN
jgi:hypothetical protein